ncbi:MAG: O-methyltransferase [Bacteroidota bacterium]|nr:O-methyltransferase [Bacteroidota bacterium]
MPEIIDEKTAEYAAKYSEATDSLLQEIENYTVQNHPHANMLSGPLQGKFLEMISRVIMPENILEIGTFMGYSALCLARGLSPKGFLHTIELRKEDAQIAKNFFAKSSQCDQIILHEGNALEIIPKFTQAWDLIFIDADKTNYTNYYELTLPHLKRGGVILADNVLFHGEVLEEDIKGKNAKAIHEFNEHITNDERVQQVILTVRDGLTMIRKK